MLIFTLTECELLHKWLVFCFTEAKSISAHSSGSSPVTRGNDQCLNFSLFFHSFRFIFLLAEGVRYHIQHTPPVYNWACAKLLNCMNKELLLCDKTNYAENWEHLHQYLPQSLCVIKYSCFYPLASSFLIYTIPFMAILASPSLSSLSTSQPVQHLVTMDWRFKVPMTKSVNQLFMHQF